jgi:predicted RNase H-like HicB family nuclease
MYEFLCVRNGCEVRARFFAESYAEAFEKAKEWAFANAQEWAGGSVEFVGLWEVEQ